MDVIPSRTLLVIVAGIIKYVQSYSEGAPQEVCDTLVPKHLTEPQTSAPPYYIELETYHMDSNPIKYNPIGGNNMINVTVSGHQGFKGFILQARLDDKVVGRFEPSPLHYKMLDCCGGEENTATHVDNSIKSEVVLKWVPPTKVKGDVWFYSSVVQNFDTYWVKISSKPLTLKLPG